MGEVKRKPGSCVNCANARKKVFRVVTPFGTVPVCKGCFSKVFEVRK
jgi:hypothetical protein